MMLSFIILTWNSEKYIDDCISSVIQKCKEENISYEILVVDNDSSDKTKDILASYNDNIKTVWLDKNYGTTYPRNIALKKAIGDIISVLDSDIVLKKGSLRSVIHKLLSHADIGILAPKLILCDGSIQRSVKKFPSLPHKLLKLKKICLRMEPKKTEFYKEIPLHDITVDNAISACWFFRKELIEIVGLLDEKIFFAPEDIDYCLRTWKSGKSVFYYPYFEAIHYTQQISHKKRISLVMLTHFRGLVHYFIKHRYIFNSPKFGEWEHPACK